MIWRSLDRFFLYIHVRLQTMKTFENILEFSAKRTVEFPQWVDFRIYLFILIWNRLQFLVFGEDWSFEICKIELNKFDN